MNILKRLSQICIHSRLYLREKGLPLIRDFSASAPNAKSFRFVIFLVVAYVVIIAHFSCSLSIPLGITPLLIVAIPLLLLILYGQLDRISVKDPSPVPFETTWIQIVGLTFFIHVFALAYLGAASSPDTRNQWTQILTGIYSDWHPIIYTGTIWLFYQLTRCEIGVLLCFTLCFALACGWLFQTLQRFQYRRSLVFTVLAIIVLSPVSVGLLRILWKDTAFGIALLLASTAFINIMESQGGWLRKKTNLVLFGCLLFYTSFVRHNGIFFTVPFLILFPSLKLNRFPQKQAVLFSVAVFLTLLTYGQCKTYYLKTGKLLSSQFPLQEQYDYADPAARPNGLVQKANQQFAESIGVPMSIMSEILVKDPDKMPLEAKDFMFRIAPWPTWEFFYEGDFNSVKFPTLPKSNQVFDSISPQEFLRMFFETCKAAPKDAWNEFQHITALGWDPFWDNIRYNNWEYAFDFQGIIFDVFGWIIYAPGFWIVLIVVFCGYAVRNSGWNAFVFSVPYVSYTIGTTLLLSGWDHRFYYGILISAPPLLLSLLNKTPRQ